MEVRVGKAHISACCGQGNCRLQRVVGRAMQASAYGGQGNAGFSQGNAGFSVWWAGQLQASACGGQGKCRLQCMVGRAMQASACGGQGKCRLQRMVGRAMQAAPLSGVCHRKYGQGTCRRSTNVVYVMRHEGRPQARFKCTLHAVSVLEHSRAARLKRPMTLTTGAI
jgi:hypothetical protein